MISSRSSWSEPGGEHSSSIPFQEAMLAGDPRERAVDRLRSASIRRWRAHLDAPLHGAINRPALHRSPLRWRWRIKIRPPNPTRQGRLSVGWALAHRMTCRDTWLGGSRPALREIGALGRCENLNLANATPFCRPERLKWVETCSNHPAPDYGLVDHPHSDANCELALWFELCVCRQQPQWLDDRLGTGESVASTSILPSVRLIAISQTDAAER